VGPAGIAGREAGTICLSQGFQLPTMSYCSGAPPRDEIPVANHRTQTTVTITVTPRLKVSESLDV